MANDTLTVATQNLVVAYGGSTQMMKYLAGQYTSSSTVGPGSVQIYTGSGRLVRVTVLVTDASLIDFYDSANVNIAAPIDWVFSLDPVNGVGIYEAGLEFTNGLVAVINGTTTINVTYSVG